MGPLIHFLVSLFIGVLLYPIFGWRVLMVFAGGILIDIDHYFLYVCRFRKFGLGECYKYYHTNIKKNNFKEFLGALLIFHTIEFLLLSAFLSAFSSLALMFTIGLLSHYVLDIIHRYRFEKSFVTNPSIISWLIKSKKGG